MYRKKDKNEQKQYRMVCIEDLVPADHLLRKIESSIKFDFIYDEVKGLYKEAEWGNPGIDPVSLFKIVFIQYLFGIRSMRQTIREIEVNNAYRWFIGFDLMEPVPHFSTFGKNYTRRFKDTDVFERIFAHILEEAVACGFVDASAVFIDGTHIKASANKKKYVKEKVKAEARRYQSQLDEEINSDREAHGKEPFDTDGKDDSSYGGNDVNSTDNSDCSSKSAGSKTNTAEKEVVVSTTDPDCGLFHKGEHEKQMAYVSNTACDRNNFILGFEVGAGNIHDSVMFDPVFDKVRQKYKDKIKVVAVDSGYRTPWIAKQIIDAGMVPAMPYKRPMTKEGFFPKYEYVYDEYYNCILCPDNQVLKYCTTNREGYREYRSDPCVCEKCPYLTQCTNSKSHQKVVTRHVWEDYMDKADDYRHMPEYRAIYEERKETIERVFADAKVKHGMGMTQLRGLQKVTMQVTLTFACMNLKKLATWKFRKGLLRGFFAYFNHIAEFLLFTLSKTAAHPACA